jgi:hypothetical protein
MTSLRGNERMSGANPAFFHRRSVYAKSDVRPDKQSPHVRKTAGSILNQKKEETTIVMASVCLSRATKSPSR